MTEPDPTKPPPLTCANDLASTAGSLAIVVSILSSELHMPHWSYDLLSGEFTCTQNLLEAVMAAHRLGIGGPVVKMCFFQMPPIPLLSVLIHSNRSQYVILKVSLKKLSRTYPLGASNIEMFRANKMPRFTCNFSHFCKRQSTYIWGISSM